MKKLTSGILAATLVMASVASFADTSAQLTLAEQVKALSEQVKSDKKAVADLEFKVRGLKVDQGPTAKVLLVGTLALASLPIVFGRLPGKDGFTRLALWDRVGLGIFFGTAPALATYSMIVSKRDLPVLLQNLEVSKEYLAIEEQRLAALQAELQAQQ